MGIFYNARKPTPGKRHQKQIIRCHVTQICQTQWVELKTTNIY